MTSKTETKMRTILEENSDLWSNPLSVLRETYGFDLIEKEPTTHRRLESASSTAIVTITQ